MIGIINLGISNVFSIYNAFKFLGCNVKFVSSSKDLIKVKCIVLPGVGTFKEGMSALERLGLKQSLIKMVNENIPLLGICLGMQMLANMGFEDGSHKGLGLIKGKVRKLHGNKDYKIPNIGWCDVSIKNKNSIFKVLDKKPFYFLHSYYFDCDEKKTVHATIKFNKTNIPVLINKKNIFGIQYHPEKSSENGLQNLSLFLKNIK